jgi:hypothetical protein
MRIQRDQAPEIRLQARYGDVDSPEGAFRTLTHAIGSTALFCGLLKSTVRCLSCEETTVVYEPFTSLSLPLPLILRTSRPFKYYPYDIAAGVISLEIQLPVDYSINDIGEQIFGEVGGFGHLGFAEQDESEYFRIVDMADFLIGTRKIYVFEIPDPLCSYAIAVLLTQVHGFGRENYTRIGRPVLVPLANGRPDLQLCEERLDSFFQAGTEAVRIPNLAIDGHRFGFDERMQIVSHSIFGDQELLGTINIVINPSIVANASQFNWDLLKQKESRSVRGTPPSFSLGGCLTQFQKPEFIIQICPHCRQFYEGQAQYSFSVLPPYLVLHLMRFTRECKKLDHEIEYPDMLSLWAINRKVSYRLRAVCEHSGGVRGGYYAGHLLAVDASQWFRCDGIRLTSSSHRAAHSSLAYVLFYEAVE